MSTKKTTTKESATKATIKSIATKATAKSEKASQTKPAKTTKAAGKPPKKMSALDAAAKVLGEAPEPMASKAMIEAMSAKGYWTSPGGQTPHATLYAAILREINTKGDEARFAKTDRGRFALKGSAATPAKADPKAKAPKTTKKKMGKTAIADGTPGPKSVSELFKA